MTTSLKFGRCQLSNSVRIGRRDGGIATRDGRSPDLNARSRISSRSKSFRIDDAIDDPSCSTVRLSVWDVSRLAVSVYPSFLYDARGGGGPGTVLGNVGSRYDVRFDVTRLEIPSLDYRSTKVLGIPIPPPLQIEIMTEKLEGFVDVASGEADLKFDATFNFSVGSLYAASPLFISTTLTTGSSSGDRFRAEGQPLVNGRGRLVGISTVEKTGDTLLDAFLMLPTEALAELAVDLKFS